MNIVADEICTLGDDSRVSLDFLMASNIWQFLLKSRLLVLIVPNLFINQRQRTYIDWTKEKPINIMQKSRPIEDLFWRWITVSNRNYRGRIWCIDEMNPSTRLRKATRIVSVCSFSILGDILFSRWVPSNQWSVPLSQLNNIFQTCLEVWLIIFVCFHFLI